MSPMSAEATVVRNYIDTLLGLPWTQEEQDQQGPRSARRDPRRRPLRPREGEGAHRRVPGGAAARRQAEGADPVPRRRRPASARPRSASRSRKRDQPQVRAHVARRRARRGRDPRPPPHLHRLDARQDPAEHDARSACAIRCSCSTKSTRWAWTSAAIRRRRCSRCSIPEQNHTFVDHYVEVEYDLSDVMFVATANTLNIPAPLLDRMEVIRLSGYTEDEKIAHRASSYLLPKQIKNNGLKDERAARRRERDARHRALLHARSRRAQRSSASIARSAARW